MKAGDLMKKKIAINAWNKPNLPHYIKCWSVIGDHVILKIPKKTAVNRNPEVTLSEVNKKDDLLLRGVLLWDAGADSHAKCRRGTNIKLAENVRFILTTIFFCTQYTLPFGRH